MAATVITAASPETWRSLVSAGESVGTEWMLLAADVLELDSHGATI